MPAWDYRGLQEELGLATDPKIIFSEFETTHNYKVNTRHQGFLFITPKNK
jgi:hypothetical protein